MGLDQVQSVLGVGKKNLVAVLAGNVPLLLLGAMVNALVRLKVSQLAEGLYDQETKLTINTINIAQI